MSTQGEKLELLVNVAATGTTKVAQIGGRYIFMVVGTFSGATVQLQLLGPDGATWVSLASGALTAAGAVAVDVPQGANVRATVASGSPSALYASLVRVPQ